MNSQNIFSLTVAAQFPKRTDSCACQSCIPANLPGCCQVHPLKRPNSAGFFRQSCDARTAKNTRKMLGTKWEKVEICLKQMQSRHGLIGIQKWPGSEEISMAVVCNSKDFFVIPPIYQSINSPNQFDTRKLNTTVTIQCGRILQRIHEDDTLFLWSGEADSPGSEPTTDKAGAERHGHVKVRQNMGAMCHSMSFLLQNNQTKTFWDTSGIVRAWSNHLLRGYLEVRLIHG